MSRDSGPDADHDVDLAFESRSFALSLARPLETAHGTIESREGVLVRLTDRTDGTSGIGEATPLMGWTESRSDCAAALERAAVAIDDGGGPEAALGAVSESVAARHAVSLALADLRATREAKPLYQLLGQPTRTGRVPVNTTVSAGPPEEAAAAARDAVERGFDCCKLKVGVRSLEADLERVRRVRAAVGEEVELRVDANGAWTIDQAERAVDALSNPDLDVAVLEQPLPAGALEGHAALRGRGVSIALDEGLLEHGVDEICRVGAADAVVLKPMAVGGVDIARELAAWVAELDLEAIVTTTIDGVVARTAAVHLAAAIPEVPACGLATGSLLAEDLGRDPVLFEKGAAVVPQAKGLGVSGVWDE